MPFDEKLLYDKRFTNIVQATLRKHMLHAPSTAYTDTAGHHIQAPNIIYNVP